MIPQPLVAYLFYRHDEEGEGWAWPLERVAPQWGTTVAANFALRYYVKEGGGTVGAHPWQAPSDGATVEIWMANEEDARTEAWWRLGCNSGSQELWVVGLKEVWGASERSARSWYWPIAAPLPDYCVGQGSMTLIDEAGNELQYLPESTDADPHYFYVKLESPETMGGDTFTGDIEGKLLSYDYEGNVLDSLTVDLIYGNYSSYYHRSNKIEAVYVGEAGDTPSVPGAEVLYTLRGGSVVSNAKGGGSKGLSTFATVIINSISFNWDASGSVQDAMTVLPVTVPEWPVPTSQIYKKASQAAYFGGITPKIKASISVIPPDKTVRIHPVSAKCGNYSMMPTCFPMLPKQTVTATADYEFEFSAPLPEGITYITDHLWWKIVLQSDVEIATFPNVTGPHDMYAIDRPAITTLQYPYPFAEVLRYSTFLVSRDYYPGIADRDILKLLGKGIYYSKWQDDPFFGNSNYILYDPGEQPYTEPGVGQAVFYFLRLLTALQNSQGELLVDCWSIVGFYSTLSRSLGIDAKGFYLYRPGGFDTNTIRPIGYAFSTVYMDMPSHVVLGYPPFNESYYDAAFARDNGGGSLGFYWDSDPYFYYNNLFIDPEWIVREDITWFYLPTLP